MFSFSKKEHPKDKIKEDSSKATDNRESDSAAADSESGFFGRLIAGLGKTRANLSGGLSNLVLGSKSIDDSLLDEIETRLLLADVGMEATDRVITSLKQKLNRKQLSNPEQFLTELKNELIELLRPAEVALNLATGKKPFVILLVGVNGAGKTTTIGKLCCHLQSQGLKPVLAAGDTFRAAAVEQLQEWGQRNNVPVVAQATGADSASVIFDAYQFAKAREADVLIADTAGRLHTKGNLMRELEKIVRVLKKLDESLPNEIMLVLDATTGQNALKQAKSFHDSVTVTGITLTKLDGTAKGGMIFAIANQLGLPIRFIGTGEKIDDLRPFVAEQFVEALFTE
ncbi:MAG: signal recognition particle-docking protein FtsY [Gammaproteobacteria bacterium]|nr:signal recognition particle-docking protein FtsY [Gammaproteobacteria bacterium]